MSTQPHPLATVSQIASTPSAQDGLPADLESDLRVVGCMLIQEAGIMLALPQSTMATAQVLFHRFFYVSSMCSFGVNDISISALYLSSKLNETQIRLRDLINTYIFLTARLKFLLDKPADQPLPSPLDMAGPSTAGGYSDVKGKGKERDPIWKDFIFEVPGFHDELFWDWKDVIVASEMQILKRLGFNMQVDLPYNHAINYCKILDLVFEDDVAQMVWSILNDLRLLTPNYAIHTPPTLACASILLTTRLLRIPLPDNWYILFDVIWDDIWAVAGNAMVLWRDWGHGTPRGADWGTGVLGKDESGETKRKEDRWRRAWILAQSRKAVRRWIDEWEKQTPRDET